LNLDLFNITVSCVDLIKKKVEGVRIWRFKNTDYVAQYNT